MLYLSPGITIYCSLLSFLLGTCMGSFLNCMAWRVVHGESVVHGRSHCDHCGHALTARDLIPIVSYLLNRGRCRWCGSRLSRRHVAAELITGLCYLAILLKYDISLQALEYVLAASLFLACAFADLEGYMIPDGFLLAAAALRLPFLLLLPGWRASLLDSLLGAFAVGGGLLLFVLLYEKLRRKEAMGGGDLKMLFVTGLYLGWKGNLLCLLLASVLGIVFALPDSKCRSGEKLIPWGPAIAAAAILCLLFGNDIIGAYLGLFY